MSLSKDDLNLVPGSEPIQMIGCDQGLLSAPVRLKTVALTPGERADLMIDFSPYAGRSVYLKHSSSPLMQIKVSAAKNAPGAALPAKLRRIKRTPESSAVKTRELTLVDYKDAAGR